MRRVVPIGEAANVLGVSISTYRRWQEKGTLKPVLTQGGHRRYNLSTIQPQEFHTNAASERKTIAYARHQALINKMLSNAKNKCWSCIAHSMAGYLSYTQPGNDLPRDNP